MRPILPALILLLAAAPAPDRYVLATIPSVEGRTVASPTITVNGGATSTIAAGGYRLTTRFRPTGDRVEVAAEVALVTGDILRPVGKSILTGRIGDTLRWSKGDVTLEMTVRRAA